MSHIISLIQLKGGAGRSTIATNLAGYLADGSKVALVDCDLPQGTSASWAAIRQQIKPDTLTAATASNHTDLVGLVKRLVEDHDYIILDTPPRVAELTATALYLSHLCLIPLGASAAEIWATSDTLKALGEVKTKKPDLDARILWTRFRSSTKSAQELSEAAANELGGLQELKARLGYRVAFSEALARGLTVAEWSEKVASLEMQVLKNEVVKILESKQ